MPFDIGTREIVIIAVIIVFLFGAKKIPEFAKMFADGIRTLRGAFTSTTSAEDSKKK